MRFLILGDSLAFSRPKHGQKFEDAWPALLKEMVSGGEVWQRARTRYTSNEILKEFYLFSESLDYFNALVLQTGIVDCVPRPYPYFIHRLISEYGHTTLQSWVNKYLYHLPTFYWRPWISKKRFNRNLREMVENTIASKSRAIVVLIKIAPACHRLLENVPKCTANYIAEYNDLIQKIAEEPKWQGRVVIADPFLQESCDDLILGDGHHLSVAGHKAVAAAVLSSIRAVSGEIPKAAP